MWYINPDWWRSRGAQLIAGGIAFLAVSLLIKHTGTDVTLFGLDVAQWTFLFTIDTFVGWTGAALVIIGIGSRMFLESH